MVKKRFKILLIFLALAGVLFIISGPPFYWFNESRQMEEATLEWGRLAPFPEKAQHFKIETGGSMFSRSFRATFKCDRKTFDKWVEASPGLKDACVNTQRSIKHYQIKPGGGAQFAEVKYNIETKMVEVCTHWS